MRRLCRETDWLRLRTVAKGEEEEEEEEPGDEALMSYCLPELMRVQLEERVARPVEDEERFNDLLAAQELVARENKEPGAEDLPSMCLSLDPLAGQPSLAGLAGLAVPQPVLAFLGGRGSGKSFLCGLVKGSSRVSNALPRTKRLRLHLQSSLSLLDSPGCAVSSWSQEASNAAEMAEYVCVVLSEDFEEQLALVQQPGSGHGLSAATQKLKFVCLNLRGCRRKEETHAVEALLARLNWRRMRIFSDSGPAEYYWTWQDLRLFLLLDARHSGEGNRVVARALASFAQHQTTSSTSKPLSELVAKCQASQSLPLPPSRLRLLSVTGKAARRLLGLEQGEERGEYVLQVAQKPDNFQSRVGRALFGPGRLLLLTGQIAMDTFQLVLPVEADNDWPTLHNPKEDSKPWILRITPNPH